MKLSRTGIFLCLLLAGMACPAQPDFMRQVDPVTAATADPAIAHAFDPIGTSRIAQTIKTLVEHDTRNSLSSMEEMAPGKGVEAAAEWIPAEFERRPADHVLGDLPESVDFNHVAKVARLNAAVLVTLASSPGEPAKVAIDAQKLENGTTLT